MGFDRMIRLSDDGPEIRLLASDFGEVSAPRAKP
jgi:hypothetical protein